MIAIRFIGSRGFEATLDKLLAMLRLPSFIMLALCVAASSFATAVADSPIKGDVIVAKTQGNGIVLWDITQSVASLVAAPGSSDDKIRQIEIQAAQLLVAHLGDMAAASTVEVRTLYQRTGDVSPIYKTATFAGVEKLLTVTATYKAAKQNETVWRKELATGILPPAITVNVTGALPPR